MPETKSMSPDFTNLETASFIVITLLMVSRAFQKVTIAIGKNVDLLHWRQAYHNRKASAITLSGYDSPHFTDVAKKIQKISRITSVYGGCTLTLRKDKLVGNQVKNLNP